MILETIATQLLRTSEIVLYNQIKNRLISSYLSFFRLKKFMTRTGNYVRIANERVLFSELYHIIIALSVHSTCSLIIIENIFIR